MASGQQLFMFPSRQSGSRKHRGLPEGMGSGGTGRQIHLGKQGSRLYLEGLWLLRSGFEAWGEATVVYDRDKRQVTILLDPDLADTLSSNAVIKRASVSGKEKRGKSVPVIDIGARELHEVFGGAEQVVVKSLRGGKLVVTVAQAEQMRQERLSAPPNSQEVALYSGAGFLSLASSQAGVQTAVAIEKWDEAAQAFYDLHGVPPIEAGVQEVALEEMARPGSWGVPRTPWVLTAGVPCEPYSKLGGKGMSADDPHALADQLSWTFQMILSKNPINVVIENVPGFMKYSGGIVRALQFLGYHVHAAVIDPAEHGFAASRQRAVIVATTYPGFTFPSGRLSKQSVRDVLLDPDDPVLYELSERHGGWFDIRADEGIGKSLRVWIAERSTWKPTIVEYSTDKVPTVPKSMYKGNPQGPYFRHPRKRDLYRLLTIEELRRLHGVPEEAAAALPGQDQYPLAVQFYGQGVHVPLFAELIRRLPGPRTVTVQATRRRNPPWVVRW